MSTLFTFISSLVAVFTYQSFTGLDMEIKDFLLFISGVVIGCTAMAIEWWKR